MLYLKRKIDFFSECMEKQSGPETVDCKRTAAGGKNRIHPGGLESKTIKV